MFPIWRRVVDGALPRPFGFGSGVAHRLGLGESVNGVLSGICHVRGSCVFEFASGQPMGRRLMGRVNTGDIPAGSLAMHTGRTSDAYWTVIRAYSSRRNKKKGHIGNVNLLNVADFSRGKAIPLYLAACPDKSAIRIGPEETDYEKYGANDLLLTAILWHVGMEGYERNADKAAALYREAIAKGSSEALNNLAVLKCEKMEYRDLRLPSADDSAEHDLEKRLYYAEIGEDLIRARNDDLPQAWYNLAIIYGMRTPIIDHDKEKSKIHLHHSSSQNFAPARVLMGLNCKPNEFEEAIQHFNFALSHSTPKSYIHNRANFGLGCIYESMDDNQKAKLHFELAAENGLPEALLQLGWMEVKGKFSDGKSTGNVQEGFKKILEAAQTSPLAMYSLGAYCLSIAHGRIDEIGLTEEKAWSLLKKATMLGSPEIIKQVANLCNYKLKKRTLARKFYKMAADLNEPESISNYAIMCLRGVGGPKTPSKALRIIKDGMSQNHSMCFAIMAKCYTSGYGVKISMKKAGKLYLKASQLGNVFGIYFVGKFYLEGIGGFPQSIENAIEYLTRAARAGFHRSYKQLALAHLVSEKPNVPLSAKYLKLALLHAPKDVELLAMKKSIETARIYKHIDSLKEFQKSIDNRKSKLS